MTATPERIRRVNREFEFAVVRDDSVLAARPDARPLPDDNTVIDSFFDRRSHAQALLEERFAVLSKVRRTEAIEVDRMLDVAAIPLVPVTPRMRAVDAGRGLDKTMMLVGVAFDFNTNRASVEIVG